MRGSESLSTRRIGVATSREGTATSLTSFAPRRWRLLSDKFGALDGVRSSTGRRGRPGSNPGRRCRSKSG